MAHISPASMCIALGILWPILPVPISGAILILAPRQKGVRLAQTQSDVRFNSRCITLQVVAGFTVQGTVPHVRDQPNNGPPQMPDFGRD